MTGSVAQDRERTTELQSHLAASRISVESIGEDALPEIHLAHFAQTTFALVRSPRAAVTWHRTPHSRGRAAMMVARRGGIRVESTAPVIVHGTNAALITPGEDAVSIELVEHDTELIFVSISASVLGNEVGRLTERVDRANLSDRDVAPLYSFIHAITEPSAAGVRDPRSELTAPAQAVARSLARLLGCGVSVSENGLIRALEYLDRHHTNPNLTLGFVAEQLGVSPRTLQAGFTQALTTFTRELRNRRIATVNSLRDSSPRLGVEELHRAAGFRSASALYRAMREGSEREVLDAEVTPQLQSQAECSTASQR